MEATGFSNPASPAQTVVSSTHSPVDLVEPSPKRLHAALPAVPGKAPSVESVRSSRSRARVRAETVALAEARVALAEARLEAAKEDSEEERLSSEPAVAGGAPLPQAMAVIDGPNGPLFLHSDNVWREEHEQPEQPEQQALQLERQQLAAAATQLQQQHAAAAQQLELQRSSLSQAEEELGRARHALAQQQLELADAAAAQSIGDLAGMQQLEAARQALSSQALATQQQETQLQQAYLQVEANTQELHRQHQKCLRGAAGPGLRRGAAAPAGAEAA